VTWLTLLSWKEPIPVQYATYIDKNHPSLKKLKESRVKRKRRRNIRLALLLMETL